MVIRKIIVQTDKNLENIDEIKVSQTLCKRFGLNKGEKYFFQFGGQKEQIYITASHKSKVPTVEISQKLREKLAIPNEIFPIHCLYEEEENTLKLGPVICCITNQMYHEHIKFGSMTVFFEELARFSKQYHIFFFVKPLHVWDETFQGFALIDDNWQEGRFPVPDAVYNRIGSRNFETAKPFKQFSAFLQENHIPYFNDSFLDKWEIHNTLIGFPEMLPYLPNTILFDDYDSFVEKLTVNNSIFIKPVSGSQGRQILRIKTLNDKYIVSYSSFSKDVTSTFRSSYLLYERLCERLNHQPFIVQQGLDLIHIDERPLDFRILCVKSSEKKWKIISSVARISPKENFVSNLAKGGEQKRPLDVLTTLFDEKLALQYLKLMRELAIETASLVSESFDGIFAELGIDIALDKEGQLWIIEVNSKPSKTETENLSEKIRPSSKAIIAYLAYLSNYSLK